jgi:hypothetical protein
MLKGKAEEGIGNWEGPISNIEFPMSNVEGKGRRRNLELGVGN